MQPQRYLGDSIFWIEIDKVDPNPYQPRREFDEARLKDLAESIRQYGVLQPLVVTRKEVVKEDGGLQSRYELIAGERRLRASKLAGLKEVPAVIRANADDARAKLELAIIENLQREDLNAVDRARAFERLVREFGFKATQIAQKINKSREYVSNSMRILSLPPEILEAVSMGKITEGHARPLLMLAERPQEQQVLFKEIMLKKLSVRETEGWARRTAVEKIRNKAYLVDPEIADLEHQLVESLGTRVKIQKKEQGGQLIIDFFTRDDLKYLFDALKTTEVKSMDHMMNKFVENNSETPIEKVSDITSEEVAKTKEGSVEAAAVVENMALDDRSKEEKNKDEEDLYSVKNFSI